MAEPTPASELRTAAATLRHQATDDEHWAPGAGEVGAAVPALARPLADWLESAAEDAEQIGADHHALAVARAINSEEQPDA